MVGGGALEQFVPATPSAIQFITHHNPSLQNPQNLTVGNSVRAYAGPMHKVTPKSVGTL